MYILYTEYRYRGSYRCSFQTCDPVCRGLFLLYGFCPKMAYILAGIPKPVIGAVFLISAASIMFSGIDSIVSSPRTLRNTLVAGITLTLAVMLPYQCTSTYKEWADGLSPF